MRATYNALPHSGHGLQNGGDLSRRWMETVEAYRCMG